MIDYVPLFQEAEEPDMRASHRQCRRCGRHVNTKTRASFASHVTTWHRGDLELGVIVRNGSEPHKVRKDAPRINLRRGYEG